MGEIGKCGLVLIHIDAMNITIIAKAKASSNGIVGFCCVIIHVSFGFALVVVVLKM